MKEILLDRNQLYGATKLMDGLYFGDILASQDLQFLNQNKISHIVNTSIELTNKFKDVGIKYYNLDWKVDQKDVLFKNYSKFEEFFKYINGALKKQKGVLIMSLFGRNRAFVACVLYLIRKFRWSLNMTIQLMNSKYTEANLGSRGKVLRRSYEKQLKFWIKELSFYNLGPKTYQFGVPSDPNNKEEVLLMHTYMNQMLDRNGSRIKNTLEIGVNSSYKDTNQDSKLSNKEVNWADSPEQSLKASPEPKQSDLKAEEPRSPNNMLVTIIEHPGDEKFTRSLEKEKQRSKSRKSTRSKSKKSILKSNKGGLDDLDFVESWDFRSSTKPKSTRKSKKSTQRKKSAKSKVKSFRSRRKSSPNRRKKRISKSKSKSASRGRKIASKMKPLSSRKNKGKFQIDPDLTKIDMIEFITEKKISKKDRIIENFKQYGSIQQQDSSLQKKFDERFTTFEQFRDKQYNGNAEVIYAQKPYKLDQIFNP